MKLDQSFLKGKYVTLEPMVIDHLEGLSVAGNDSQIWDFVTFSLDKKSSVTAFIGYVSALSEKGGGQSYAIRLNETKEIVGGTGYWHIDHQNRKLEIGGSWVTPKYQKSMVNTEAKYLMIKNAFDNLKCNRVSFNIDALNEKSLRAIERIGAEREGISRNDMQMIDGRIRDSVIYSIVKDEWPIKKLHLEALLSKYDSKN